MVLVGFIIVSMSTQLSHVFLLNILISSNLSLLYLAHSVIKRVSGSISLQFGHNLSSLAVFGFAYRPRSISIL